MKFVVELRTGKGKYRLFGGIIEYRRRVLEYMEPRYRTTVAIVPPGRITEGVAVRLWGYDKISEPQVEP